MSAANIIGNGAYAGTVSSQEMFKAAGVASVAVGAPTNVVINLPYVKSTDTVLLALNGPTAGGATITGLTSSVQNSGLDNATLTISATVVGTAQNVMYMVVAGVM